jgi:hypothetical protein
VQGNLQRFLPLLLLVFLLLFVLPAILHKHKSHGLNAKELSQETIASMNLVVAGQKSFTAEHGRYTTHVADLIQGSRRLAKYVADGVVVQLDASTNGKTFYTQVASGVIVLVRSQTGDVVLAKSCDVIKSSSGVACPGTGSASTTTSTTSTTSTTTTTTTSTST